MLLYLLLLDKDVKGSPSRGQSFEHYLSQMQDYNVISWLNSGQFVWEIPEPSCSVQGRSLPCSNIRVCSDGITANEEAVLLEFHPAADQRAVQIPGIDVQQALGIVRLTPHVRCSRRYIGRFISLKELISTKFFSSLFRCPIQLTGNSRVRTGVTDEIRMRRWKPEHATT